MAEISKATNLEAFKSNFKGIEDSQHNVTTKTVRGQPVIVKGSGKGRLGRFWFALKHPTARGKQRAIQSRNRSVVNALKSSSKKDFGDLGPKLVSEFLKKKGIDPKSSMTADQVKQAVDYVKDKSQGPRIADWLKKGGLQNPLEAQFKQLFDNPNGRTAMKLALIAKKHMGETALEQLLYLEAREDLNKVLGSNKSLAEKRKAFGLFVATYASKHAHLPVNLKHRALEHLTKAAENPNLSVNQMKEALKNCDKADTTFSQMGDYIAQFTEDFLRGKTSVDGLDMDNLQGKVDEAMKKMNFVGGNGKGGDITAREGIAKAILNEDMYGRLGDPKDPNKALDEIMKNPFLAKALESFFQGESLDGDVFHTFREAENLLAKFPNGGPKAKDAANLFFNMFVKSNAKLQFEVGSDTRERLQKLIDAKPMDWGKVSKMIKDISAQARRAITGTLVQKLDTPEKREAFGKNFVSHDSGKWQKDNGLTDFRKSLDKLQDTNDKGYKKVRDPVHKNLRGVPGLRQHFDKLTFNDLDKLSKINNMLQQRNEAVRILSGRGVNI